MRKIFRLCCLAAVPFLLLRIWDLMTNIDYRTGFFLQTSWFRHILILLTLTGIIAYLHFSARRTGPIVTRPVSSAPAGALFSLAGSGILVGSVLLLILALRRARSFSNLFASKTYLLQSGYYTTHFRTEFWCALSGFAAAVWFFWAALQLFRSGDLSVHPIFSCLPVAWYCFRAFTDYSFSPINPNNTLVFACLMSDLLIGLALYRLLRYSVSGYPPAGTAALAPFAAAAFIFVISFKLPVAMIPYSQHEAADKIYILADAFAAAGVFAAVDTLLVKRTNETETD